MSFQSGVATHGSWAWRPNCTLPGSGKRGDVGQAGQRLCLPSALYPDLPGASQPPTQGQSQGPETRRPGAHGLGVSPAGAPTRVRRPRGPCGAQGLEPGVRDRLFRGPGQRGSGRLASAADSGAPGPGVQRGNAHLCQQGAASWAGAGLRGPGTGLPWLVGSTAAVTGSAGDPSAEGTRAALSGQGGRGRRGAQSHGEIPEEAVPGPRTVVQDYPRTSCARPSSLSPCALVPFGKCLSCDWPCPRGLRGVLETSSWLLGTLATCCFSPGLTRRPGGAPSRACSDHEEGFDWSWLPTFKTWALSCKTKNLPFWLPLKKIGRAALRGTSGHCFPAGALVGFWAPA